MDEHQFIASYYSQGQQAHPHFCRMQMAYWLVTK